MYYFEIQIIKIVDTDQPGWVACQFQDAHGHTHHLIEKIPVVTTDDIWLETPMPCIGVVACELIKTYIWEDKQEIALVDTSEPWGVETTAGLTQFELFGAQIAPFPAV